MCQYLNLGSHPSQLLHRGSISGSHFVQPSESCLPETDSMSSYALHNSIFSSLCDPNCIIKAPGIEKIKWLDM